MSNNRKKNLSFTVVRAFSPGRKLFRDQNIFISLSKVSIITIKE